MDTPSSERDDKVALEIDAWMEGMAAIKAADQARVLALLIAPGEDIGRALTPMREAAIAQLQAQNAAALERSATYLGVVGILLTAVSAIGTIAELYERYGK